MCVPHRYFDILTGALYPLELIKTRMQVINDNTGTYRSLTKAFGQVVRNEGIKGLYQGVGPALFAASGSWGGYFYFYERSKERKQIQLADEGLVLGTMDHVRILCVAWIRCCDVCDRAQSTIMNLVILLTLSTAGIRRGSGSHLGANVQPLLGGED